MRSDWLPYSASALVTGAMALVLGALLNPLAGHQDAAQALRVVDSSGGRWLGMAVMFFLASITLTLGLPALWSLFHDRGHRSGLLAISVFAVGAVGLSGYAMLLVFVRALVERDMITAVNIDVLAHDSGLKFFLYGWVGGFYLGVLLVALALFLARRTSRWVPTLFLVYLALAPFGSSLGRLGMTIQVLALALGLTAVAIKVNAPEPAPQPAF
jgi:hypothetical protein